MDASIFFKGSKSVWVSENFQNIFLDNYTKTQFETGSLLDSSDLQNLDSNKNVQEFIFEDSNAFLEKLATLIEKQINGEEGELLNDSSANYFFLKGKDGNNYSVLVRWEPAQKLWRCGAYLQEHLKMPNVRIFYPKM